MLAYLRTLYAYRELLWMWTLREIKIRYKQSFLGATWAILQPLSLTLIFTVVFSFIARIPTNGIPYPIFAYTALVPWTLFSTSISFAVPSLVNNMHLVTKIYFPKEILPLASIGAAILDFLVASLIFLGMMVIYRISPSAKLLWALPLLAIQVTLIIGVGLLAAAVNVFYRDIRFVVPLVLQLWMYASPIIYPMSLVPERFRLLYILNPMAGLINGYRQIVLQAEAPQTPELVFSAGISLILCISGYLYFKRTEPEFADIM